MRRMRRRHPERSLRSGPTASVAARPRGTHKVAAIKPGTPDPYTPPAPGQLVPQEHLQIGPIVQYITTLHHPNGRPPADVRQHEHDHGLSHAGGA